MAECEKVAKYRRHLQKRQASDAELQNNKNRKSVLYIPLNKPKAKKCHDQSAGALVGLTQVSTALRISERERAFKVETHVYSKPQTI